MPKIFGLEQICNGGCPEKRFTRSACSFGNAYYYVIFIAKTSPKRSVSCFLELGRHVDQKGMTIFCIWYTSRSFYLNFHNSFHKSYKILPQSLHKSSTILQKMLGFQKILSDQNASNGNIKHFLLWVHGDYEAQRIVSMVQLEKFHRSKMCLKMREIFKPLTRLQFSRNKF